MAGRNREACSSPRRRSRERDGAALPGVSSRQKSSKGAARDRDLVSAACFIAIGADISVASSIVSRAKGGGRPRHQKAC